MGVFGLGFQVCLPHPPIHHLLFPYFLQEEDTEDRDFQPMVNDQGVVVTEAEQDEEEEEDEDEEEENVEDDEELSDDEGN